MSSGLLVLRIEVRFGTLEIIVTAEVFAGIELLSWSPRVEVFLVGNGGSKQGIRLRAGTEVEIDNAKVCGKGQPLTVETALTENALKNGTSKLTNITLTSELSCKEGIYTHADFIAVTSNKVDANLSYSSFEDIKKECSWMNGSWVK